jgi:hypothetical protein
MKEAENHVDYDAVRASYIGEVAIRIGYIDGETQSDWGNQGRYTEYENNGLHKFALNSYKIQ